MNTFELEQLFREIARRHLSIKTLETRHLDFQKVSIWGVKSALQAAYDAGLKAAAKPKKGAP